MANFKLPVTSDSADQKFSSEMAGETFVFRVKYNTRASKWHLSISDENESPIFSGATLALGVNYLELYTDERLPDGILYVFNFESPFVEPTRENLGSDVFLVFDDLQD